MIRALWDNWILLDEQAANALPVPLGHRRLVLAHEASLKARIQHFAEFPELANVRLPA
jgi:hypothetical protein